MKRKMTRLLSLAMAAVMALSLLPAGAVAAGLTPNPAIPDENNPFPWRYVSEDGRFEMRKVSHPASPQNSRHPGQKYADGLVDDLGGGYFAAAGTVPGVDDAQSVPAVLKGGRVVMELPGDAQADGQGSRGQNYCWGSVGYGDYMYVNTLFNAAGSTEMLFNSTADAQGGQADYDSALMDKIAACMYRGDYYKAEEPNTGCALVKVNVKTGETKLIMSNKMTVDSYGETYNNFYSNRNGMNPQFRNAVKFNGKLYFIGAPSGVPSIWEIDPETDNFRRVYADPELVAHPEQGDIDMFFVNHVSVAIRGIATFQDHLVISCVGADANPYIAISNTSDPADGFTRIASAFDPASKSVERVPVEAPVPGGKPGQTIRVEGNKVSYSAPGELLGYPACRLQDSIYGGSIWEMIPFNGKLYVAMCTGTPENARDEKGGPGNDIYQSFAIMSGEYDESKDITDPTAWTWTPVIGDKADGAKYTFGIDPERTRSGACCMMVMGDHLYIGEYNDTEIAMLNMLSENGNGAKFMADNLDQAVSLYRMDKNEDIQLVAGDPTEMFPTSLSGLKSGFGEKGTDHGNQYIWKMQTFRDKLYIGTFDESVVMHPLAQVSNGDLLRMSREDWEEQLRYIKEMIEALLEDSKKPAAAVVNELLEAQTEMEALLAESVDLLSMAELQTLGEQDEPAAVSTVGGLYKGLLLMPGLLDRNENWTMEQSNNAHRIFVNLYQQLYQGYQVLGGQLPQQLRGAMDKLFDPALLDTVVQVGRMLTYLSTSTEGFDLYEWDGQEMRCITRDGMGDPYNSGLRAFAVNEDPENPWMTIGTANIFYGAQVWRLEGDDLNRPAVKPEPKPEPQPDPVQPTGFRVEFRTADGALVEEHKLEMWGLEGITVPQLDGRSITWAAEGVELRVNSGDYMNAQTLDEDAQWTEQEPTVVFKPVDEETGTPEVPEEPVRGDITVTFRLNERGWIGRLFAKTMQVTVTEGQTIKAPRVHGGRLTLRPLFWATAEDQLVIRAKEAVSYDQLLELLGGTTANGSAVEFRSHR